MTGWLVLSLFVASQVGTPGPANISLMAHSARFGVRESLPFFLGVVFGKQLIIWPIGFGLVRLLESYPVAAGVLQAASILYLLFIAWRIANMSIVQKDSANRLSFWMGLPVHPLNPKACAMIVAAFTTFLPQGIGQFEGVLAVAVILLIVQLVLQAFWMIFGGALARLVIGTSWERTFFRTMAIVMMISVGIAVLI